jgi:hypothetical protein
MSETTTLPADVPEELVQLMVDAEFDAAPGCSALTSYRTVLAAVLPVHRQMVIDQIACQPPGTIVMTDAELAERDAAIRQQVRAEVADEIEAYALKLRDAAVDRVLSDDPGRHAAARRYATVMYVAQALRNSADLNVLAERKGGER